MPQRSQRNVRRTPLFLIKSLDALTKATGKYQGKKIKVFVQSRLGTTAFEKNGKTKYGIDFLAKKIKSLNAKSRMNTNWPRPVITLPSKER